MYIDRKYREDIDNELSHFEIQVKDTDLSVSFLPNDGISIDEVRENLFQFIYEKRRELEKFIEAVPHFKHRYGRWFSMVKFHHWLWIWCQRQIVVM